jgi:hypothetical protein
MRPFTAFLGVMLALVIDGPCQDAMAAGKPLGIAISSVTVTEGQTAHPVVSMSGGNGRAVTIKWWTDNSAYSGTATIASTKKPTTLSVPVPDDVIVNGTRTTGINAVVTSGSVHPTASASITVLDNDVAPPPPPPPAGELAVGGSAKGMMACQSLVNPNDAVTVDATYTVVGFAGRATIDTLSQTASRDYVVLNDATHLGDGYFGIMVPVGCVAP